MPVDEAQPPRYRWMGAPGTVAVLSVFLVALSLSGSAAKAERVPPTLVIDLRLFEARSANPDLSTLGDLNYFVNTDGRGVTANQWLATLSNRLPGSLLAQLAYQTIDVKRNKAQFAWTNGPRSIEVEIGIDDYQPSEIFKARVATTLTHGEQALRAVTRDIDLQLGRTSLWSGAALELSLTEYISFFREYRDRENRGALYEKLRSRRVHLIMAATTRLRRDGEIGQMTPEKLVLPREANITTFENLYNIPLKGTVRIGFELNSEGKPVNPQVIRSTLPEANAVILGESLDWRFPVSPKTSPERKWGYVEVKLDIPSTGVLPPRENSR